MTLSRPETPGERGSVSGALILVALLAAGLFWIVERTRASEPDLASTCAIYTAARQAADTQAASLDATAFLQVLGSGRQLNPSESAALKTRVDGLRSLYADLNHALGSVVRTAGRDPDAPRPIGDQARSFLDELDAADRAHRESVERIQAAETTAELIDAFGRFDAPAGPSLVERRALYGVIAAEPACRPLIDAAVLVPSAPAG